MSTLEAQNAAGCDLGQVPEGEGGSQDGSSRCGPYSHQPA